MIKHRLRGAVIIASADTELGQVQEFMFNCLQVGITLKIYLRRKIRKMCRVIRGINIKTGMKRKYCKRRQTNQTLWFAVARRNDDNWSFIGV